MICEGAYVIIFGKKKKGRGLFNIINDEKLALLCSVNCKKKKLFTKLGRRKSVVKSVKCRPMSSLEKGVCF